LLKSKKDFANSNFNLIFVMKLKNSKNNTENNKLSKIIQKSFVLSKKSIIFV